VGEEGMGVVEAEEAPCILALHSAAVGAGFLFFGCCIDAAVCVLLIARNRFSIFVRLMRQSDQWQKARAPLSAISSSVTP